MPKTLKKESKRTVAKVSLFSTVILFLLGLLFSSYALAQPSQPGVQPSISPEDTVTVGTPLAKMSSDLRKMRRISLGLTAGQSLKSATPETTDWIVFKEGNPVLEFNLNTSDEGRVEKMIAHLQSSGCTIVEVYPKYGRVYSTCDLSLLNQIAADEAISTIYPAYKPIHNRSDRVPQSSLEAQGAPIGNGVDNRADVLMKSDQVRAAYNVNGSGVKVGIISDSFDDNGTGKVSGSGCSRFVTGTSSQTSGNLPPVVYVLEDSLHEDSSDEGRAMSELVYDVAPGATLMFHWQGQFEASMADAIDKLRSCGADIIADDIFFFKEPVFQDGIIAQAAQAAVNRGVAYFSLALNDGPYGVFEEFSDNGTGWHDFGSGNTKARITINNKKTLRVAMQWNDPFSGTLGPGATRNLDLYLVDADNKVLASSTNTQGCNASTRAGDPYEFIYYKNTTGTSQDTYLKVKYKCGSKSDLKMRIYNLSNGGVTGFDPAIFKDPTIYGHPMAEGVVTVAAMDVSSKQLEPFTSLGGHLPIYFSPTGTPLSPPQTRTKPTITAPDGVNTSMAHFSPFEGTSAATPNAAAVGALVLSYQYMTPTALTTLITSTAAPVESSGWHPLSGYGLIDALNAFHSIGLPPGAATLTQPTDTITTTTPTYAWDAVSNSTWYYLWVDDSTGTKIQQWYRAADAGCGSGGGTCSVRPDFGLAQGPVKGWVQTWNANGYGPWSAPLTFTVNSPLPEKALLVSPSGTLPTVKPTYTWTAVANSYWYYLWVNDSSGTRIQSWYKASDAGCRDDIGACSVTSDIALSSGSCKWWVQTWNSSGFGPWSDGMAFTVNAQ